MKAKLLMLGLLMATMPATAQTIHTGVTEWDKLPPVKRKARPLDASRLTDWVSQTLRSGEYRIPGMSPDEFDIDVRYAALVNPDGTVQRIIMAETGCAGLNTVIGSTIHDWVQRGDFRPTGFDEPLWFTDRITFARE